MNCQHWKVDWSIIMYGNAWWSRIIIDDNGYKEGSMVICDGRRWFMTMDSGVWWSMTFDGDQWCSIAIGGGR